VDITRRELISTIAKTGVPAAVAVSIGAPSLHAETENIPVPSAAVGLLYDASICIGCKACESACAEANDTPPDTRGTRCIRRPTTSTISPATLSSSTNRRMARLPLS